MFRVLLAAPALLLTSTTIVKPASAQEPMEIVVNIPAGRLDVIQGGARVRSFPVSAGLPRYATPTGQAAIRRMVWNPSWTPPDAEWAKDEEPKAPGPNNPMGRVKMHLFRDYYVHGTPAANERRLGRPASHGCIRMANRDVMELARLVLRADGHAVTDSTLAHLAANPRTTRELALSGRVRVRIEYRLAELGADSVTLHPDVYARAPGRYADQVGQELRAAGEDPALVLAHLAETRAPAAPVRIARDGAALAAMRQPTLALSLPAGGSMLALRR